MWRLWLAICERHNLILVLFLPVLEVFDNRIEIMVEALRIGIASLAKFFDDGVVRHCSFSEVVERSSCGVQITGGSEKPSSARIA